MGRILKMVAPIVILLLVGLGGWMYSRLSDKGNATEIAADAVVDAASAAASALATDRRNYTVTLYQRLVPALQEGGARPVAVRATFHLVGGSDRAALCGLMPRARDSVNVVLSNKLPADEAHRVVVLQAYRDAVLTAVNGAIERSAVKSVDLDATTEFSLEPRGC